MNFADKREWLIAAILAAAVILVGWVAYGRLHTTTESADTWQHYAKAYFSIDLPDQLTETHETRDRIGKMFSDYALYTSHNDTNLIAIEEMDFAPDGAPSDPDAFVNERAGLIENAPGVKISFKSGTAFKGNIARRYDFYLPESDQYTKALLVYRPGTNGLPERYYTLSELSKDGRYDDKDFERLLSSFEPK